MMGKLIDLCGLFFGMTVIAYVLILLRQHSYLQPANYRLTVLSSRAAVMLPLCSLFIFIAAMHPGSFVVMMLFVTITEGYCLYTFFALITANLGGPNGVVESIEKSEKRLLCHFCLPKEPIRFYRWTNWALFHLIALRGVISMISVLCFYANTKAGRQAYVVYNFLSALVLLFGMICLVNLCKHIFHSLNYSDIRR